MKKYFELNDGNKIPSIGLGTWRAKPHEVGDAVRFAIAKANYTHIDCASIYGNEKEIGEAFSDVIGKAIKREELFVTGKLWNTDHRPEDVENACRKTLSDLQLDYLDLYLMHWGVAFQPGTDKEPLDKNGNVLLDNVSVRETWQAMEGLVKKGLVKSIGVCNFTTPMIIDLLAYAQIKPAMNQVEMHPYNTQEQLVAFCQRNGVMLTAYSPLGRMGVTQSNDEGPKLFEESVIQKLIGKYHKSAPQILLNWAMSRGTVAIPKSITPERLKENLEVFDFELTAEEQGEIAALNKNYRFVQPNGWWGVPYFS